jgi:hypothetical protein
MLSFAVILGVVASILLGSVSNWVYDLLRAKGIFPNKVSIKTLIVVGLASVPLVLLAAFPEVFLQKLSAFSSIIFIQIPFWALIIAGLSFFAIGYFLNFVMMRKFRKLYFESSKKAIEIEKKLHDTEMMLDRSLNSHMPFRDTVIKPK